MAVIETWFEQDLQKPVKVRYIDGNLFSHNGNGNRIGVVVTNNGEAVTLTGTVSGYAVLADGTTVPCTGTRSGNKASILVPAAAYSPGSILISIFLTDGTTVTTLAALSSSVIMARTGNQIDPGSVVADWTNTINAAMQSVETAAANLGNIVATPYANLTFPVPLGKYTIYNNGLYRCISPIASSEAWTAAHWTNVKLGDDVADLKSALEALATTGENVYSKDHAKSELNIFSTDTLYNCTGVTVGTTKINNISTAGSPGAYTFKIPLGNVKKITYPVFKSSSNLGSFIFNEEDTVLWMYSESSADTGTAKTIDIPKNASYMLLSISSSLDAINYNITIFVNSVQELNNSVQENKRDIETLYGITYSKTEAITTFDTLGTDKLYQTLGMTPYISKLTDINQAGSLGAYALKIPLDGIARIKYPVFKSSSSFGSFIFDSNNTILWMHTEATESTGTMKEVVVPNGASYMLLSISSSLNALSWSVTLYGMQSQPEYIIADVNPFEIENRNLCLAGIKTDILTNKIPYHRGYLFHRLENYDNMLWYGENFENIKPLCVFPYDPKNLRFAISPKDGRIIATRNDNRSGIWVWDGKTFTHIDNFDTNPMAWLYNSGVDFINGSNNVEYCVFAEYTSSPSTSNTLNVWRGTYPYTAKADWEIVLSQVSDSEIDHFHMIRRDPWSNVLYCTSGDLDSRSKWWYSTDYGANWTLLVTGASTGWGDQICRTINFIFTKDYVYWAIDHGENKHALYRISRNSSTHILDLTTKEKLTDLPGLFATNSLCYVESPRGLFMYDRVDTVPTSNYGQPIPFKFWDLESETLKNVITIGLTSETWGGCRGKCYVNYTNGRQPYPAMGFSSETPCIFDLVSPNVSNIGTICFGIDGIIRIVDY